MKRARTLVGLVAATAALAASLIAASPAAAVSGWSAPAMVWNGDYQSPAMAIDSLGHAHIAVRGDTGIWYLTNAAGSWTRTRLTTDSGSGDNATTTLEPVIAIDASNGAITVAYTVRQGGDGAPCCALTLTYRTNSGHGWSSPHAIPSGCEHAASLAARNGTLAVAAVRTSSVIPSQVWFCTNAGGSWSAQQLPQPHDGSQFSDASLALDSHGKPHITYRRWSGTDTSQVLWYASGSTVNGDFSREKIAKTDVEEYGRPSLALNAQDQPRVAFTAANSTWFSYRNSTGWHAHAVMGGSGNAALVVDASGPHIAATDVSAQSLWYATNSGGTWLTTHLDSTAGISSVSIGAHGARYSVAYQTGSGSPRVWLHAPRLRELGCRGRGPELGRWPFHPTGSAGGSW